MKKFTVGDQVTYRHSTGVIDYIDKEYLTLCFLDNPAPATKTGRHRACLIIYRQNWDEIYETPS